MNSLAGRTGWCPRPRRCVRPLVAASCSRLSASSFTLLAAPAIVPPASPPLSGSHAALGAAAFPAAFSRAPTSRPLRCIRVRTTARPLWGTSCLVCWERQVSVGSLLRRFYTLQDCEGVGWSASVFPRKPPLKRCAEKSARFMPPVLRFCGLKDSGRSAPRRRSSPLGCSSQVKSTPGRGEAIPCGTSSSDGPVGIVAEGRLRMLAEADGSHPASASQSGFCCGEVAERFGCGVRFRLWPCRTDFRSSSN